MKEFPIPLVAIGPGSQPAEDAVEYLPMPQGMNTFNTPHLPEQADEALRNAAAEVLERLADTMADTPFGTRDHPKLDLATLAPAVVALVNESLGQGEVSVMANYPTPLRVQETVFAGVWRVQIPREDGSLESDRIEACAMPESVGVTALAATSERLDIPVPPEGVMNAPALLQEVTDVSSRYKAGQAAHIINLTLLPVTPADLDYLVQGLGAGSVAVLSRGYGNCRISSTRMPNVWWVQYFNSMDALILNTIEIVDMPEVALAAAEDYADSIERLREWALALREG